MSQPRTVSVHILDKEYPIACPPDQEQALLQAARYLDRQMRGIRESGKVIGLERIAVMAALNIAHELLAKNDSSEINQAASEQVRRIDQRIDDALQKFRQLDIG